METDDDEVLAKYLNWNGLIDASANATNVLPL